MVFGMKIRNFSSDTAYSCRWKFFYCSFFLISLSRFKSYTICKFHRFVDHSLVPTVMNLMDTNNPNHIKFCIKSKYNEYNHLNYYEIWFVLVDIRNFINPYWNNFSCIQVHNFVMRNQELNDIEKLVIIS